MILLAAGHSVTNAATASGYSNVSAYITAFREAFGVTPAAYCRLRGGRRRRRICDVRPLRSGPPCPPAVDQGRSQGRH
jgi:AraC-like DNA-binding protein